MKWSDYDYDEEVEDDEDDPRSWKEIMEEEREARLEEQSGYATTCTCGAWKFNSKGDPVHVADCFCGAE